MNELDIPYFPTNFVSKEDLLSTRPDLEPQIHALSDVEVENIANKVGDALQEMYWVALGIVLAKYLGVSEVSDADEYPDKEL